MLRTATEGDRDVVLGWRNHPEVRRVSLTTHVIPDSEHRAWWERAQADERRRLLIYEREGRPCGVVIYYDIDHADRSSAWGFYLDVVGLRERGDLLPAWLDMERDAVDYAFDVLKLDRLGGETLAWNTQVLALHRRFGFRETRRYQQLVDGAPQDVVWTELRAAHRTVRSARANHRANPPTRIDGR